MCVNIHTHIWSKQYTYTHKNIHAYVCMCIYMYMCTHICVCEIFIHIYRYIFIYKVCACIWTCMCMYLLFRFPVPVGTYIPIGMYTYKQFPLFLSLNEKLFSELYFFFQASHNGNIPFLIAQLSYTQSFWCNFQGYDHTKLCFFHDSKIEVSTFTAVFPGFHFSA